jgi:hypothetical protein
MASETSFQDRVQRAGELRAAVVQLAPAYAPPDVKFSLPAFTTAITVAETANGTVESMRIPFTDKTDDREVLVRSIGPLVTQSLAYVKSNTAWAKRYEAVKKAADKVRGVRPTKKKAGDPEPDTKKREQGERSYVEIAGFFRAYVDRVTALAGYAPPDGRITEDSLNDRYEELNTLNKAIPTASQALADAISDRAEAFTGATGLKFVFDGVKTSVKGQYGQGSAQFRGVSGMRW